VLSGKNAPNPERSSGIVVAGSAIGAVLASSCCILPLVLITLGVGGTWIGTLTSLKDYQPIFVVFTVAFLGVAFWRVYRSPGTTCDDATCAPRGSRRVVKTVLWASAGLGLDALTSSLWAPYFY